MTYVPPNLRKENQHQTSARKMDPFAAAQRILREQRLVRDMVGERDLKQVTSKSKNWYLTGTPIKEGVLPNYDHLKIQLRKQETSYTCGPASLMMAMSHFGPVNLQESVVAKDMRSHGSGTSRFWMAAAAKKYGFKTASGFHGTIDTLRDWISKNCPVVVMYQDTATSWHYAVAVAAPVYSNVVVIADPWTKSLMEWPANKFLGTWKSPSGGDGWWMAVWPKAFDPQKFKEQQKK